MVEPQQDEVPETVPEAEPRGLGIKRLLKAVAIVLVVVLVEVVAASVLVPSAHDAEATARQLVAAERGDLPVGEGTAAEENVRGRIADEPTVEVDLGQYNVTRYNPLTDSTLVVDFELYGVVLADERQAFTGLYEKNQVRLREQVIITLGGADATDLTDPELGLLKRRILEKTNRALGKPIVQEVLFSKFNFVER